VCVLCGVRVTRCFFHVKQQSPSLAMAPAVLLPFWDTNLLLLRSHHFVQGGTVSVGSLWPSLNTPAPQCRPQQVGKPQAQKETLGSESEVQLLPSHPHTRAAPLSTQRPYLSVCPAEVLTGLPSTEPLCLQLLCTWTGVLALRQPAPSLPLPSPQG
jgi:hypothetical protein